MCTHTHMFTHIIRNNSIHTHTATYIAYTDIDMCEHKLPWADRYRPKSITLTFLGHMRPGWEQLKGCPGNTCPEWRPERCLKREGPTQLCSSTHKPNQVSQLDKPESSVQLPQFIVGNYTVRLEEARDGRRWRVRRRHPQGHGSFREGVYLCP